MNLINTFSVGGPIMLVLLGLSIFSLALLILKFLEIYRLHLSDIFSADVIITQLRQQGAAKTIQQLKAQPSPLARASADALELALDENLTEAEREKTLGLLCSQELRKMERGLGAISIVAHVSPLLGLLGTVTGMINAFHALESAGLRAEPALLAGGIWEALLTTAFGLIIAIPLLAAFHYFEARIDTVANQMQLLAAELFRKLKPRIDASVEAKLTLSSN